MATPNLLAITSIIPTVIVSAQVTSTAETVLYTVPASKTVKITGAAVANISGSACTVGLSIVQSGGTVDGTHKLIPDTYSLPGGDSLPLKDLMVGRWLGDGDRIAIHVQTINVIDVVIDALVMT